MAQYNASQLHERLSAVEGRVWEAAEDSELFDAAVHELPVEQLSTLPSWPAAAPSHSAGCEARRESEKGDVIVGKHMESPAEPVAEQPSDLVTEDGDDVLDTSTAPIVAEVAMQPAPQGATGAAEQVVVPLVEQRDGSLVATPSAGPATASDAVGPQVDADEQPVL